MTQNPTPQIDGVAIEVLDIDDLIPDDHNANVGTPRGTAVVDHSLDRFGAGRGIALDAHNRVVAGNKTTASAKRSNVRKVIVVETEGDVLVATRRKDFDLKGDDPTAREYGIADNRASELGLEWNPDVVSDILEGGADLSVLFYDDELARLIGGGVYYEEDESYGENPHEDEIPEMALHPFEHYDYMLVMFRTTFDWGRAVDMFGDIGLVKKGMTVSRKTKKVGLCRVIDGAELIAKLAQLSGSISAVEGDSK